MEQKQQIHDIGSQMCKNNRNEEAPPKMDKHDKLAPTMTLPNGAPVDNNAFSLTAGENGPVLLSDIHLIEKLAHFDRERIPERVVHARGGGAHGYFEVTHDISKYSKADVFNKIGKQTPVLIRFSRVVGERGSADTERDVRGFAAKFYTEQGNWDLVGNNFPVFFHKDPMKFVDLIHSQKRHPQTDLKDPNSQFDFFSLTPESVQLVTMLFSDRGIPDGYRHMHGYGVHSFKLVNADGEVFYAKFHFICENGIKNLSEDKARVLYGDPDYYNRDLFTAIAHGKFPSWSLKIQVMTVAQAADYKWDVLDPTKIWPHSDFPLMEVGRVVLNKNQDNYFAEIEQSAFSPANLVPGIEPSEDRMLASRLFSYNDTHRYRLGVNYRQIPVNCPYRAALFNGDRDGLMNMIGNQGSVTHYEPNSSHAYAANPKFTQSAYQVTGLVKRHGYTHPNSDFEQTGMLYRDVMTEQERTTLVQNLAKYLGRAKKETQQRMIELLTKCDAEYGANLAKALDDVEKEDSFLTKNAKGSLLDKADANKKCEVNGVSLMYKPSNEELLHKETPVDSAVDKATDFVQKVSHAFE